MRKAWLAILVFCALSLLAQDKQNFLRVRMVRHGQPGVAGTDFTPEDKAAYIKAFEDAGLTEVEAIALKELPFSYSKGSEGNCWHAFVGRK